MSSWTPEPEARQDIPAPKVSDLSPEPVEVSQGHPGDPHEVQLIQEILDAGDLGDLTGPVHDHKDLVQKVGDLYRDVLDRSIELDGYETSTLDEVMDGLVLIEELLKRHEIS